MAKGQAALEFILLVSFMFLVFVAFFAVIQDKLVDVWANKAKQAVIDQKNVLQNEIQTAAVMEDGFSRNILLPASLNGNAYNVTLFWQDSMKEGQVMYIEEPHYESSFTLSSNVYFTLDTDKQYKKLQQKVCLQKKKGKLNIDKC